MPGSPCRPTHRQSARQSRGDTGHWQCPLCAKSRHSALQQRLALFGSRRPLFIPPALRERNVRLREFVSYGCDSMFHCRAIAL